MSIEMIDVSRWQDPIDWACMRRRGIKFAAMRATVANYYTDPTYEKNADGAKEQSIIRPPYHVTRAEGKISGMDNSPQTQMDFFAKAIEGRHDGVVILDCELYNAYDTGDQLSKGLITDTNMACWEIARSRYDFVLFYSRADFLNSYMKFDDRFKLLDLWLADYGLNNGLNNGILFVPNKCSAEQIVIQQYTSKGTGFCCGSLNIDLDTVVNRGRYNEIFGIETEISGEALVRIEALELQLTTTTAKITELADKASELEQRINHAHISI